MKTNILAFLIFISLSGFTTTSKSLSLAPPVKETGTIRVDYVEYWTPTQEQRRIAFAWDTKTGKAVRYYYDIYKEKWFASIAPFPENPLGEPSSEPGEIMMDYHEYWISGNGGGQRRVVFVWNTKTGKTARYYYNLNDEKWHKSTAALPENPLGEPSKEVGEIMIRYTEYWIPGGDGGQRRTAFVWNTKTGKSARYYYNLNNEKWYKSTAVLPMPLVN